LLATEGVKVDFAPEAVDEVADIAERVNAEAENIGARRLHTVLERVMEDISFEAPTAARKKVTITRDYVQAQLRDILKDQDLKRFIL
jgi:ATP-dependent HslUV protease ATP-binding subunit HslU